MYYPILFQMYLISLQFVFIILIGKELDSDDDHVSI